MTENKLISKTFEANIVLNWKSSEFRILKRAVNKKKLTPFEIPVKFKLKINIPETPELKAEGEITLSESKAKDIIITSI